MANKATSKAEAAKQVAIDVLHSIEDLEPAVDRLTPYGQTTTIVHSWPVDWRPLDPGA